MDQDKRKRLIFLIGALFVGIMFLSSYGAFGNNSGTASTTTAPTSSIPATYFVTNNFTNGTIYSYSNITVKFVSNVSNATLLLNSLELNGSLESFTGSGNVYKISLGNMSIEDLNRFFSSRGIIVNMSGSAMIGVPKNVVLYYSTKGESIPVNVTLPVHNFSEPMRILPIGSNVPVHIIATVFPNGTAYQESFSIYKGLNGS